jgi:hypothetical protein
LLFAVRARPVATFFTATVVLGNRAPPLSVIVPPIAPVVADCAKAAVPDIEARARIAKRAAKKLDFTMQARLPDLRKLRCIP